MNKKLFRILKIFCCLALVIFAGRSNLYAQAIPSCGTNAPLGPNLICNGDFERGDSCFTTQYTKHSTAPDVNCGSCYRNWSNPNEYEVVTNVTTQFHTGFTSTPNDHTPTGTNNFMAVDGACEVGKKVWCQDVNVTASTNYYFTMWYTSLHSNNPALLQFDINGTNVGTQQQLGPADGIWYQYTFTWSSGATSGNVSICIENMTVTGCGDGNDFAIDDIAFTAGCQFGAAGPQPSLGVDRSLCLEGSPLTLNSGVAPTGTMNVTWSTGATGSGLGAPYSINVSAAGTYSVCVRDNGSCIKSDVVVVTNNFTVDIGPDVVLCNPITATYDAKIATAGTTYQWFKNGAAISGATSRTYTTNTTGTYRVDVTVPGCGTVSSNNSTVTTQAAVPNNDNFCPPEAATLSVTGTGTYEWYSASTGGTLLTTGSTYNPTPGATTTYWVKDVSTFSYTVGESNLVAGSGTDNYTVNQSMVFDAFQAFNLDAVTVFADLYTPNASYTIGVTLHNSSDAVIWTQTVTLIGPPVITNPVRIVVPVNRAIAAGTDYRLSAVGTVGASIGLKWNQTTTVLPYPYTVPGVISIKDLHSAYNWLPANAGYGYFYDWEISAGVDCQRVPVIATYSCPLPVELLNFDAKALSGKVLVTWQTANEKNSSHFIVQRSSDGIHFEAIGTVQANGNSNSQTSYTYTDYSPLSGISYYRLVSFDQDGTSAASPVRVISNTNSGVIINPNPNHGSFNISFRTEAGSEMKLTLINPLGQVVYEETLHSSSEDFSKDLNIHHLASGIYFLHLQGEDEKSITKIVKE